MVRDHPHSGGLSHDNNQPQMGIFMFATRNQNLVQRLARSLAPSASTGFLLVDRHADRDLRGQDLDRIISIGAALYHRMAVPTVVRRRVLEPKDAPPMVCSGNH